MTKHAYELETYIRGKHEEACSANYADFKPTHQAELDDISRRCVTRSERGKALIVSIADEDLKVSAASFF